MVPVGQAVTQDMPWHRPPGHAMLQSPQPPAGCGKVPGRHWQAPPVQYCEPMHMVQPVPQCSGSDEINAQVPPHSCAPAAVQVHWPLTHISVMPQSWPQRPQLWGSFDRSAHTVSQATWPAFAQAHAPEMHDAVGGQALPH
jgi:hypothetical protein